MIVVCDEFDFENYPVYVRHDDSVKQRVESYDKKDLTHVDEVYSKNYDKEEQLKAHRTFHTD